MQIRLIILTLLFSLPCLGNSDAEVEELFSKYDRLMEQHQFELIDEIFSKKFLADNGGKEELIEKIKELPKKNFKSNSKPKVTWKKSLNENQIFANLKPKILHKSTSQPAGSTFVLTVEEEKLKIDGTSSDHE